MTPAPQGLLSNQSMKMLCPMVSKYQKYPHRTDPKPIPCCRANPTAAIEMAFAAIAAHEAATATSTTKGEKNVGDHSQLRGVSVFVCVAASSARHTYN